MPDINILINAKDNASAPLKKVSGEVTNLGNSASGANSKLSAMTVAMGTVLGNIATAGIAKLGQLGVSVITTGINFSNMKQQAQIAFSIMLGSGEEAKVFLDDLQSFAAAATPFEFPELLQASQRMLAMGFAAEDVKPTLTAVGDAVAALGGSGELVGRVTTALGQMQAKGKASAEEMAQLTEAGIPGWKFLAEAIGTDVAGAMEMVSDGAVDAKTVIDAVATGMNEDFGGMMAQQSQTWGGLMSTLSDTFTQLSGTVMGPLFERMSGWLGGIVEWVSRPEFAEWATSFGEGLDGVVAAVSGLITIITGSNEPLGDWALWWETLAGIFGEDMANAIVAVGETLDDLRNMVTLASAAISALITGDMATWKEKIEEFGTLTDETLEPMREWFAEQFPEAVAATNIAISQLNTALDDLLGSDTQDDFALTKGQMTKFTGFLDDILSRSLAVAILRIGEFMASVADAVKFMDAVGDGDWKRAWEAITETQERHTTNMVAEALIWSGEMEAAMRLAGGDTMQGFIDGLKEKEGSVTSSMEGMSDSIQGSFTRALEIQSPSGVFKRFGESVMQGFIDGLNSMVESVRTKIEQIAQMVADAVAMTLGIQSPSTVFMEMGQNVAAGFGLGIEQGMSRLGAVASAGVASVTNTTSNYSPVIHVTVNATGKVDEETGRQVGRGIQQQLRERGL